jgi:ribonuclease HII
MLVEMFDYRSFAMPAESYPLFDVPTPDPVARVAGADEAGRGPLAGAVYAAAVILDPARPIEGLNDSKKLTARRREILFDAIQAQALAWCIASASREEIDRLNILQASMLAMQRAVAGLAHAPTLVLVDGNRAPDFACPARAIVGGDALEPAISAASILAKVARDRSMLELHALHPQYGFDKHKGYPTAEHLAALAEHGPCPEHRVSFAPVKRLVSG